MQILTQLGDAGTLWQNVVQETKLALKEQMCAKSPMLMRWLKRPMTLCWAVWKDKVVTEKRNREVRCWRMLADVAYYYTCVLIR